MPELVLGTTHLMKCHVKDSSNSLDSNRERVAFSIISVTREKMFGQMHETRTQRGKNKVINQNWFLTLHHNNSVINEETYCKRS